MTGIGLFVGILAGVGVIAIAVIVAVVLVGKKLHSEIKKPSGPNEDRDVGFALFKQKASDLLHTAPRGSKVSAKFPIPPVEVFVKVSGRKADQSSFQLEIRMGYKRFDHLEVIEQAIEKQALKFERIDKGNGAIKLLSEKAEDATELLDVCRIVKSAVMFDLNDKGISVAVSLRKGEGS